ncbi:MAG TPA: Rrf2 family transcriptional regulator [Solirubrobacteraceae bacterium]|nr:Rrf2 family transcriptional regulator [Solirubrobacteraceae bacterium]
MAQPTNTQFALAVHVLTLLSAAGACASEAGGRISSEFLAGSAGSNPVHVRRLLGRLRTAGLVQSRPGPSGGWRLAADPSSTTLADVWTAVHGDDAQVLGLHFAAPDCTAGQAIQAQLADLDRRAATAITAELRRTTLTDLVTRAGVSTDLTAPPLAAPR